MSITLGLEAALIVDQGLHARALNRSDADKRLR